MLQAVTYVQWMGVNDESEKARLVLLGQVTAYCEQIKAGAKPCAQLLCLKEYVPLVSEIAVSDGCKIVQKEASTDISAVFIYKSDFIKPIINELLIGRGDKDPTLFEVWATGKLFGYSDAEIYSYLQMHGYLKDI
jgi:hypothetical protein